MSLFHNLNVVLVRAENPVNIGQAARAMKNFGAVRLKLVRCVPHQVDEAYTPGWKAKDILDRAQTYELFEDALAGSGLSIGFTTRIRNARGGPNLLHEVAPRILEVMKHQEVHLIFGNEKNGLSNDELAKCHVAAMIPTHSQYHALNLAHAVAIVLYEISSKTAEAHAVFGWRKQYFATDREISDLMKDFSSVMVLAGYRDTLTGELVDKIETQIAQFFQKARIEHREIKLFKAFLSKIRHRMK